MKLLHFLLLLPVAALSQNISVVSAEKLNVVYRGVDNPIRIAVPGAKSFIATATGMRATDEAGKYIITPGSGVEVKIDIEAIMRNDSILHETKRLRIKNLPAPTGTLNGEGCSKCVIELSKQELIDSEITVVLKDFLYFDTIVTKGFKIHASHEGKHLFTIEVEGSHLDKVTITELKRFKQKNIAIVISDINYFSPGVHMTAKRASTIKIKLTD